MDVSRRTLARLLAATAVVPLETSAQSTPQAGAGNSDAELNLARERMRNISQRLAKVSVPMATEPAFRFKA